MRLASEFQHLKNFHAFKFEAQTQASYELRVSTLGRGSHVLRPVFGLQHLAKKKLLLFWDSDLCFLLFIVRYSLNPLTKKNHFSHIGGADPNVLFSLQKITPIFTGTSEERQARLTRGSVSALRELISDGRFESVNRHLLRKPVFLFGDAIDENEEVLFN